MLACVPRGAHGKIGAMSTEVRNPFFARVYTRMVRREPPDQVAYRRELLEGLSGRVVEICPGAGANFAHYPATVTEVVAAEPEPYLREQARSTAATAPVRVQVIDAVADELPLEDGALDAAVASLVLCTVPDPARTLRELHRVLRPGGELRFYEHVHAHRQPTRAFLEIADRTTLWPRMLGGCHPTRETGQAIEAAGFEMERCRRFGFSPSAITPSIPHILGVARRS
jgi:ubiquinone/menaquinone biosynthesis C-methylase UbiE